MSDLEHDLQTLMNHGKTKPAAQGEGTIAEVYGKLRESRMEGKLHRPTAGGDYVVLAMADYVSLTDSQAIMKEGMRAVVEEAIRVFMEHSGITVTEPPIREVEALRKAIDALQEGEG